MPKKVPKSSRTAESRSSKRRKSSELQPNSGRDSGESVSKRPNRTNASQRLNQPQNAARIAATNPSPPSSAGDRPEGSSHFLMQALRRIRELQDEIDFLENDPYAEDAGSSDEEHSFGYRPADGQPPAVVTGQQAEALGFAVCVQETMAFLEREGIAPDSQMVINLRNRLIGMREQDLPYR